MIHFYHLKLKFKAAREIISFFHPPSQIVILETVPCLTPGMTKVHPNIEATVAAVEQPSVKCSAKLETADAAVLTVWKKSLLFNCKGFTVFDAKGNLVFRVDTYMAGSGSNGEIILMDSGGKPIFTIRRKVIIYDLDESTFCVNFYIHV